MSACAVPAPGGRPASLVRAPSRCHALPDRQGLPDPLTPSPAPPARGSGETLW